MATAKAEQKLAASAETVWAAIGAFGSLADWHPAVESLEPGEGGKLRRLHITGGALFVERLEQHDDHARSYTYTILESPVPVTDYHSTLSVTAEPGGKHCLVRWIGHFQPKDVADAEAEHIVFGIYRAGLDALKQKFG